MCIKSNADFAKAYPILTQLITDGTVSVIDGAYVGRASDGVEVQVGSVGYEESTEQYLTARPTPDMW